MLAFKPLSSALLCTVFLLSLPQASFSRNIYRYTNTEGNMVVNDRIPSEYSSRGYEVLNEKGTLIKVVPKKLTEEELEHRGIEEKMAAAAAAEQVDLRKQDESLLLRYSSIEDIEAARERVLRDMRIRVSTLKSNIHSLKARVENYQTAAADTERSGGTVDLAQLTVIEELQLEIGVTERSIVDRQAEIEDVQQKFQQDIDRFGVLLGLVELRRTLLEAQD